MPEQLTVELMGGLGNQLFQIAAAYVYAKQKSMHLVFTDTWDAKPGKLPIWATYFSNVSHGFNIISRNNYENTSWIDIYEMSFPYSPIYHMPGFPNYKLKGYFQSTKYFGDCTDEIRSLLQVPDNLIKMAKNAFLTTTVRNPDGWIAAHVRREEYRTVTDAQYFKKAREEISKRIGPRTVCWITEDSDWVYKNVIVEGDCVISAKATIDFACLSQFRHIIMSNSSFSWWATWLNPNNYADRVICCPNKWFDPDGPDIYDSIYEPEWIRIETTSG